MKPIDQNHARVAHRAPVESGAVRLTSSRPLLMSVVAPMLVLLAGSGAPHIALAQVVVSDTMTGTTSTIWTPLGGACLTAGNNAAGSVPACVGLPYYGSTTQVGGVTGRLPDAVGSGALRLTNGDTTYGTNGNGQAGAVVSKFMFPSNQGLQVTFTTVTYGGNGFRNGSGAESGADGMSFFLADAGTPAVPKAATVGAQGGSLGYSCSNTNGTYNGVVDGYIGLGIDEYGNFSSADDNTSSGWSGGGSPNTISLRGAGSTAWSVLSAAYPALYPPGSNASTQQSAVRTTCRSGYLWNFSSGTATDPKGASIASGQKTTVPLAFNYPYITRSALPSSVNIFSQEAIDRPKRGSATPISYALKITQDGLLSLSYSVAGGSSTALISNQSITASNGPLPANFRFGFSAGTASGSNVHEITCFKAAPSQASNSSAGANNLPTARVQTLNQVYTAYYDSLASWGGVLSTPLQVDSAGNITLATKPTWDASCVLTGGSCAATGATNAAQTPGSRAMLTWTGLSGAPFQTASLTSAEQTALGISVGSDAELRYLRGDRSTEIANGGTLRTRVGVLGDIVNSSPTWIGPPLSSYKAGIKDALYPSATGYETSYSTFASSYAGRTNVLYVGSNDGFLHGFRAGNYSTDSATGLSSFSATSVNDGRELLAYMPAATLSTIHSTTNPAVDYSSTQYSHNFFVDATPASGDLFYNGAWHTWLVGGTGYGGNTQPIADNNKVANGVLFGLDITDPTRFSEINAAALVMGEWTSSTLRCATDPVAPSGPICGANLGSTVGTPLIRRLHNGDWGVIFGNGLNSQNGGAGLFVMVINHLDGTKTFRYLPTSATPVTSTTGTGTGSVTTVTRDGIAYVTAADLDGDLVTDYVYGGDVFGNLWRFDLTSSDPAAWAASAAPLFTTPSGQPITTRVLVSSVPMAASGSKPRIIVSFGTGQQFPQTLTSAATYATGGQALYGIWDWNMSAWNANARVPLTAQYASLTSPQTVTSSLLRTQTATFTSAATATAPATRAVTSNPVCWAGTTWGTNTGSSSCTGAGTQFGWTLSLPTSTEQVIFNPTSIAGVFVVNTYIPAVSQALTCNDQPSSGWTMAINMATGGATPNPFFTGLTGVSGEANNFAGSSTSQSSSTQSVLISSTSNGTGPQLTNFNKNAAGLGSRISWAQLR